MKKKLPNSTSSNHPSQSSPTHQATYQSFPIWEKVYIDLKELNYNNQANQKDTFFISSSCVQINKTCFIFPKYKTTQTTYAIFDLETEQIQFKQMTIECYNPVVDPTTKLIYLYTYDTSYGSDYRYNIVIFNPSKLTFTLVPQKGIAPKARMEGFTSFVHGGKIFFFGGVQSFSGDNSINLLFSFSIKDYEWKIENYNNIVFHNDNPNLSYIANTFNVQFCGMNSESSNSNGNAYQNSSEQEERIILIGGKYFDDVFYSNMSLQTKIQNSKESSEIIEFKYNPNGGGTSNSSGSSISLKKLQPSQEIPFTNHSVAQLSPDSIIIHNKGNLYLFNTSSLELSMLKPRLYSPESISNSSMVIYNDFLYIIGTFKSYDDCYIFKTSLENITTKWNSDKLISYENLLNRKECSDMQCSFNNGEKSKEIYLNKKILFNFSLALKNVIINWSQNSNVYIFNDINYITMYNILKFIYSNFNEPISNLEIEIINEIFFVLLRYRAKSLLNIIIDHLVLSKEKAVSYYELALKHNITEFSAKCEKFISENLKNGLNLNEGNDLKISLYENYFCEHKIYIQCNIVGIDIKNVSQMTITNDKVAEIKDLSKDGKLLFCLNCKKVFKGPV